MAWALSIAKRASTLLLENHLYYIKLMLFQPQVPYFYYRSLTSFTEESPLVIEPLLYYKSLTSTTGTPSPLQKPHIYYSSLTSNVRASTLLHSSDLYLQQPPSTLRTLLP